MKSTVLQTSSSFFPCLWFVRLSVYQVFQYQVSWIDRPLIHHTVTQLWRKMGNVKEKLAPSSGIQWYCRKMVQLDATHYCHRVPLLEKYSFYSILTLKHFESSWELLWLLKVWFYSERDQQKNINKIARFSSWWNVNNFLQRSKTRQQPSGTTVPVTQGLRVNLFP